MSALRVHRTTQPKVLRFSLIFLVAVGGCYTMAPAEPGEVMSGDAVRARISREEASRLTEVLGRSDPVLEGTILEKVPGGVLLDVMVANRQVGFHFEPLGQRVQIGFGEILEMERKELHRWRTGGLIAGLGVAVGFLAHQALGGDTGGGSDDPPGGDVSDFKILTIGFRVR